MFSSLMYLLIAWFVFVNWGGLFHFVLFVPALCLLPQLHPGLAEGFCGLAICLQLLAWEPYCMAPCLSVPASHV